MKWIALFFPLILVGCAANPSAVPVAGVVPDSGGLQVAGSPLRIDFWRAEAGVLAAVSRVKAAGPVARNAVPGCGDLVVWADGLKLIFVAGSFRGWALGEQSAGVVCG